MLCTIKYVSEQNNCHFVQRRRPIAKPIAARAVDARTPVVSAPELLVFVVVDALGEAPDPVVEPLGELVVELVVEVLFERV